MWDEEGNKTMIKELYIRGSEKITIGIYQYFCCFAHI